MNPTTSKRSAVISNLTILLMCSGFFCGNAQNLSPNNAGRPWQPDRGDGTYEFMLISSSFNCTPGIPILQSKDLVNWRIVGHVPSELSSSYFNLPRHGKGCWAPSIRFYNREFYVYYGDPDFGIYMIKSKTIDGPWECPVLVKEAKGWVDPCPLWDDDGSAYLVHAWAKCRAGFNSILTVNRMSPDGKMLLDEGITVFDGRRTQPTIEGPKFYKRNGYYYICAPAGGVSNGWQTVLRSKNIYGPYEEKIVLKRGRTSINGPHQGAWVESPNGESWFVHFQERGAYGRVVHLEPMMWKNDWPIIGVSSDGKEWGEPVPGWRKPDVGKNCPAVVPQTSDEFDSTHLGLQWQWHANYSDRWYSLAENPGSLRLRSVAVPESCVNLWIVPNLLLQKFCAPRFTATTRISFSPKNSGEKAGLIVMGIDYSYLGLVKREDGIHLVQTTCKDAEKSTAEREEADISVSDNALYLRVNIDTGAVCRFSYSKDGNTYKEIGREFPARPGKWIGAKVGIFSLQFPGSLQSGFADYEWFRVQ